MTEDQQSATACNRAGEHWVCFWFSGSTSLSLIDHARDRPHPYRLSKQPSDFVRAESLTQDGEFFRDGEY